MPQHLLDLERDDMSPRQAPQRGREEGRSSVTLEIVVPCYNEARRLPVGDFNALLARRDDIGLIFVDDGSRDATAARLEEIRRTCPSRVELLLLGKNGGKAAAVRHGLRFAAKTSARFVGYLDADLSTPLEEVEGMLASLEQRPPADAMLGIRLPLQGYVIARSRWRRLVSFTLASSASLLLGYHLRDTQCGAKLFRNGALLAASLSEPFVGHWLFDIELLKRLDVVAKRDGRTLKLVEYPLGIWIERGASKVKLKDYLSGPYYLLRSVFGAASRVGPTLPAHEQALAAVSEQEATR